MTAEPLAIFGLAFLFIFTGIVNRRRRRGPWRAFLAGGCVMAAWEVLRLFHIVQQ